MSERKDKKERKKRRKHTALIICQHARPFWTTQAQFWQWARERVIIKIQDRPLTGIFVRENEELLVVLSNTVLNLANPNHLREALSSRRLKKPN
ncbi:MAG TPA: hypothetical protein VLB68_32385 [Pyrinomonadaceae bacterium]|nr:hypothetical protein [Pyrinomonadaceae bacterium]